MLDSSSPTLTINGGSSSVKFALFSGGRSPTRVFSGQIDRIGTPQARLTATRESSHDPDVCAFEVVSFAESVQRLVAYLRERLGESLLVATQ